MPPGRGAHEAVWPTVWSDEGGQGLRGSSPQEEKPKFKEMSQGGPPVGALSPRGGLRGPVCRGILIELGLKAPEPPGETH